MSDLRPILATLAFAFGTLSAQQTGDANRDYLINGAGSGLSSPVAHQLLLPGSLQQTYRTQDAAAPVIWAAHPTVCVGDILTPLNSVDLCIDPQLQILMNGVNPQTLMDLLSRTNGQGTFALSLNLPHGAGPLHIGLLMAHIAPSSLDAFWVSQVHELDLLPDGNLDPATMGCAPGAADITPLLGSCSGALGADDGSTQITLQTSAPFNFYGVAYTSVHICSNGFVTFGSCNVDLSESVSDLLQGPPRIAAHWDDLNPAVGGQLLFFSDQNNHVEICWQSIPEFGSLGANSFKLSLETGTTPTIILDLQSIVAPDGLVGISPGSGLDPTGRALNFSLGSTSLSPGEAVYELFHPSTNPYDLNGRQIRFLLDGSGQPALQL